MAENDDQQQVIIIKRPKKGGGGHHGGAWKVAYADFVTAMMAFFLLLWLLNVTTDEQKNAISSYFDPAHPKIAESVSGAGGILGGLSTSLEGANVSDKRQPVPPPPVTGQPTGQKVGPEKPEKSKGERTSSAEANLQAMREAVRREDERNFQSVADKLQSAISENEDMKALAGNIFMDVTEEGLRIQIVDQEGESMFPLGSARMYEKTEKLLKMVGEILKKLPNEISIRGHTDAKPYRDATGYSNWELSADRANASRRVLLESDLKQDRIANVMGKAATEPLIEDDPLDPKNRRISIIVLRQNVPGPTRSPSDSGESSGSNTETGTGQGRTSPAQRDPGYEPSEGEIQFP